MEKILNVKIHNQTEEVASKAKNEARNTANESPHGNVRLVCRPVQHSGVHRSRQRK